MKMLKKVLIVEDDADLRATLSESLTREGYHVVASATGEEALARLRTDSRVGLVLLDIMLPVKSGWNVFAEMKNHRRLASIPVVAMSANRVQVPGADAVLGKPIRLSVLLATVQRCLSRGTPGRKMQPSVDRAGRRDSRGRSTAAPGGRSSTARRKSSLRPRA